MKNTKQVLDEQSIARHHHNKRKIINANALAVILLGWRVDAVIVKRNLWYNARRSIRTTLQKYH
jgi:hypothetical protein